jgi:hypothetical protein
MQLLTNSQIKSNSIEFPNLIIEFSKHFHCYQYLILIPRHPNIAASQEQPVGEQEAKKLKPMDAEKDSEEKKPLLGEEENGEDKEEEGEGDDGDDTSVEKEGEKWGIDQDYLPDTRLFENEIFRELLKRNSISLREAREQKWRLGKNAEEEVPQHFVNRFLTAPRRREYLVCFPTTEEYLRECISVKADDECDYHDLAEYSKSQNTNQD